MLSVSMYRDNSYRNSPIYTACSTRPLGPVLQPQNIVLPVTQHLSSSFWEKRYSLRASVYVCLWTTKHSDNFKRDLTKYDLWTSTPVRSYPGELFSSCVTPKHRPSYPERSPFPPLRGIKARDFILRFGGLFPKLPSKAFHRGVMDHSEQAAQRKPLQSKISEGWKVTKKPNEQVWFLKRKWINCGT